jgi:hypothetical protein
VIALCDQALGVPAGIPDIGWAFDLAVAASSAAYLPDVVETRAGEGMAWYRERGAEGAALRLAVLLGRTHTDAMRTDLCIAELGPIVGAAPDLDDAAMVAAATELARAHMLAGDLDTAARVGEPALRAAERLDLVTERAELLNTIGCVRAEQIVDEGLALLQESLALAREHGLARSEMRALVNLSGYVMQDDPRALRTLQRQGIEVARRVGDRVFEITFTINLANYEMLSGEFQTAREIIAAGGPETMPELARLSVELQILYMDVVVGDPGPPLQRAVEIAEATASTPDPQFLRMVAASLADIRLLHGGREQVAAGLDGAMGAFEADPLSLPWPLFTAYEAAAWLRDADRLDAVLEAFARSSTYGMLSKAFQWCAEGAREALRGDHDRAGARYSAAIDLFRSSGLRWMLALTLAEFAHVASGHPDAAAAAAEADALAAEIGAGTVLDRLRALR